MVDKVLCLLLTVAFFKDVSGNSAATTTSSNVCGKICCANYWKNSNGVCEVCPPGTFGANCTQPCPFGYYGELCKTECNCKGEEVCVPTVGCVCSNCTNPERVPEEDLNSYTIIIFATVGSILTFIVIGLLLIVRHCLKRRYNVFRNISAALQNTRRTTDTHVHFHQTHSEQTWEVEDHDIPELGACSLDAAQSCLDDSNHYHTLSFKRQRDESKSKYMARPFDDTYDYITDIPRVTEKQDTSSNNTETKFELKVEVYNPPKLPPITLPKREQSQRAQEELNPLLASERGENDHGGNRMQSKARYRNSCSLNEKCADSIKSADALGVKSHSNGTLSSHQSNSLDATKESDCLRSKKSVRWYEASPHGAQDDSKLGKQTITKNETEAKEYEQPISRELIGAMAPEELNVTTSDMTSQSRNIYSIVNLDKHDEKEMDTKGDDTHIYTDAVTQDGTLCKKLDTKQVQRNNKQTQKEDLVNQSTSHDPLPDPTDSSTLFKNGEDVHNSEKIMTTVLEQDMSIDDRDSSYTSIKKSTNEKILRKEKLRDTGLGSVTQGSRNVYSLVNVPRIDAQRPEIGALCNGGHLLDCTSSKRLDNVSKKSHTLAKCTDIDDQPYTMAKCTDIDDQPYTMAKYTHIDDHPYTMAECTHLDDHPYTMAECTHLDDHPYTMAKCTDIDDQPYTMAKCTHIDDHPYTMAECTHPDDQPYTMAECTHIDDHPYTMAKCTHIDGNPYMLTKLGNLEQSSPDVRRSTQELNKTTSTIISCGTDPNTPSKTGNLVLNRTSKVPPESTENVSSDKESNHQQIDCQAQIVHHDPGTQAKGLTKGESAYDDPWNVISLGGENCPKSKNENSASEDECKGNEQDLTGCEYESLQNIDTTAYEPLYKFCRSNDPSKTGVVKSHSEDGRSHNNRFKYARGIFQRATQRLRNRKSFLKKYLPKKLQRMFPDNNTPQDSEELNAVSNLEIIHVDKESKENTLTEDERSQNMKHSKSMDECDKSMTKLEVEIKAEATKGSLTNRCNTLPKSNLSNKPIRTASV